MTRICYVTGVPGVGKTTLCKTIISRHPAKYCHVNFGQLIASSLTTLLDQGVAERELRSDPTRFVTQEVLQAASSNLFSELAKDAYAGFEWLMLDSHAVSQDWFGFVATPDGPPYFSKLRYSAIIHLYAAPEVILARSNLENSGRQAANAEDVSRHESLLQSVTVAYSMMSGCPAYFVASNETPTSVADRVDKILSPGARQVGSA